MERNYINISRVMGSSLVLDHTVHFDDGQDSAALAEIIAYVKPRIGLYTRDNVRLVAYRACTRILKCLPVVGQPGGALPVGLLQLFPPAVEPPPRKPRAARPRGPRRGETKGGRILVALRSGRLTRSQLKEKLKVDVDAALMNDLKNKGLVERTDVKGPVQAQWSLTSKGEARCG